MPLRLSWSLASPTLETIVEEAERCEQSGLDGVWFPDYEPPFDPGWPELYVTLSSLASRTKRVFVGSLITDVLRRHPMVTAHAFASLSHLAPNRIILGMGAGAGSSQRPYGMRLDHLAGKLEEGIKVIRALYDATAENTADYSGKYFALHRAGSPMKPASQIPIYVAAYGPKMLSITARYADGWLPESHTPQTYRDTFAKIQQEMKMAGRAIEQFEPCLALIFYPGEPDDKAYSRLLRAAKRYLAEYPDILWTAGEGKNHPGLRTQQLLHKKELWNRLADEVPDKLADSTIIHGSTSDCTEKLVKFVEAGCQHIILEPYWIERKELLPAIGAASEIRRQIVEE